MPRQKKLIAETKTGALELTATETAVPIEPSSEAPAVPKTKRTPKEKVAAATAAFHHELAF